MIEFATGYLWCNNKGYALTNIRVATNKYRHLYMHHLISGKPLRGLVVDHINRNPRDNRRENLHIITQQQNMLNSGMYSHNTSGFKGVAYIKCRSKWVARIVVHQKDKFLGYFDTKEAAIKARKDAEVRYGFTTL